MRADDQSRESNGPERHPMGKRESCKGGWAPLQCCHVGVAIQPRGWRAVRTPAGECTLGAREAWEATSPAGPKILRCGYARASLRRNILINVVQIINFILLELHHIM